MKSLEKKELILKVVQAKTFITAREIFLALCILYPEKSKEFKSPMEVAKLIETISEIKFKKAGNTSPKIYYI